MGSKIGIFLLHGITKNSGELAYVKKSLEEKGYCVETPNLPRHGLCPREYETCWRDVLQLSKEELLMGVEESFRKFNEKVDEIFVGGNSIGANLAFYLASKFPVKGILALNPVYRLAKGLEFILRHEPKISAFLLKKNGNSNNNDLVFHNFNIGSLLSLLEIVRDTPQYVKGLSIPTLLIFSKNDDILSPKNVVFFDKWLKCEKELHIVNESGHGLPYNSAVLPLIDEFIKNYALTIHK
ncbi:MAG TPA: hypothetical protein ENF18_08700 [candidate division WOR-3 bacterium]|uniref:Serine aminopeptidase S33 domain-containing protein n=1 Tax=candidate division WOR-3 bacterium TaxID=2052148 RepID=A0A7C0ZDP8_UNCW3|nr:hypothetical protein [candidate division WOR-3 bacterium]